MHKKGQINTIELIFYLVLIIIVAIFIFIVALKYFNAKIETTNLETFILTKRLIYSESCLAYKEGDRLYQGIVDLQKLEFSRLQRCFSKESMGYTIKITDFSGTIIKSASNLNARQEAYLPICESIKGYECVKKRNLVSYYDNGEIKTGLMILEVIKNV